MWTHRKWGEKLYNKLLEIGAFSDPSLTNPLNVQNSRTILQPSWRFRTYADAGNVEARESGHVLNSLPKHDADSLR